MKPIAINTHIDCANNSKCSVRDILRATKQGAFESVLVHFLLKQMPLFTVLISSNSSGCQEIAVDFTFRSKAGFGNCVGCIDGMLLWIEKPFPKECEKVGIDSGKFYCSQRAKFGLNLQGIYDACCSFTYISVQHPALASDYLSFCDIFVVPTIDGRIRPPKWILSLWRQCLCQ